MVEFETAFGRYRLKWQPKPLAEELRVGQRVWRPCIPDFRMVLLSKEDAWNLPVGMSPEQTVAFREAVPALRTEIPAELASAVEKFGDGQWPMLVLLRECPDALDLARNSPALFYCLSNSNEFRGTAPGAAAIQALFRRGQRQREVLEWLGFPGTESLARMLRKIPAETANASVLRSLRNITLTSPDITHMLTHVPRIAEGILSLVIYQPLHRFLTPKLLAAVATAEDEQADAPTAARLEQILAIASEVALSQPLKAFESREQVQSFLELAIAERDVEMRRRTLAVQAREQELLEERRRRAAERRRRRREERLAEAGHGQNVVEAVPRARRPVHAAAPLLLPVEMVGLLGRYTPRQLNLLLQRPFPPPPYPGTETILPLASAEALRLEGISQQHCAGNYLLPVLAELAYLYKVTHPERGTLSLSRSGNGWRLSQVKGAENARVSAETMDAVRTWLHRAQLGAAP
jgi:hypothetical protein